MQTQYSVEAETMKTSFHNMQEIKKDVNKSLNKSKLKDDAANNE